MKSELCKFPLTATIIGVIILLSTAAEYAQIMGGGLTRNLILLSTVGLFATAVSSYFVYIFKTYGDKASRSLKDTQNQFRSLIENLPGAVFRGHFVNGSWQVQYLSEAIESLTGYGAGDFIHPCKISLLMIVHEDDLEKVYQENARAIKDRNRYEVDFRIRTRSGEVKWIHARCKFTPTLNTDDIYLEGILIDITEQRRVAELLTEQQSRLASSARLSSLGEMAGGIAHEINNPLAIIHLRTHQLSQLALRGDVKAEEVLRFTSQIESTSIRIAKIVKSLQTLARDSTHDPFETASLKGILSDAFEICFPRIRKAGVQVMVNEYDETLEIECRRVQISQVLINLLNNAFDAVHGNPYGFVRVSIRPVMDQSREFVEIDIIDSGNGIPADVALKIFQPFFTTKGPGKGTGLGLSISKRLIESHEGQIWLDQSHPNTRIVLRLPKTHSPLATNSTKPEASPLPTFVDRPDAGAPRTPHWAEEFHSVSPIDV